MKKVLVVVCAVAFCLGAASADAQVPYVQPYFDDLHTVTVLESCPTEPLGTLYVVAHNFNIWMSAIEYQILYPAEMIWLGDAVDETRQLKIGTSPIGISIAWKNNPGNAFGALRLQTASIAWACEGCQVQNIIVKVVRHPESDDTMPNHMVRSVDWPDEVDHWGVGMAAVVCPTVPVEETTWGGIKAQYDE